MRAVIWPPILTRYVLYKFCLISGDLRGFKYNLGLSRDTHVTSSVCVHVLHVRSMRFRDAPKSFPAIYWTTPNAICARTCEKVLCALLQRRLLNIDVHAKRDALDVYDIPGRAACNLPSIILSPFLASMFFPLSLTVYARHVLLNAPSNIAV